MVDFKVVRSCSIEESLSFSSLTHHDGFFFRMSGKCLAWENSQHFAMLSLVSPPSDVWETSAEIPYWWREHQYPDLGSVSDWLSCMGNLIQPIRNTIQIWVMVRHQYEISVLVSQTSLILVGKPFVASPNVGCFLRLGSVKFYGSPKSLGIMKYCQ